MSTPDRPSSAATGWVATTRQLTGAPYIHTGIVMPEGGSTRDAQRCCTRRDLVTDDADDDFWARRSENPLPDGPAPGAKSQRTLAQAIKASLDRFEFGYHELSDAEAEAVTIAVYEWLQGHRIDLLEFRG